MRGTRSSVAIVVALGTLMLATGCGSATKKPDGIRTAPALQAALQAARLWVQAVDKGSCATLAHLDYALLSRPRCRAVLVGVPAPTLRGVAQYGPVVMADLTLLNSGGAAAMFVLRRGTYAFTTAIATGHRLVGTRPLDNAAATAMLGKVLPAIARGSCTTVARDFQAASLQSVKRKPAPTTSAKRQLKEPSAANCFGLDGSGFQTRLKQGRSAPSLLGGNARIAFYRVGIGPGHKLPEVVFVLELGRAPVFFRAYVGGGRVAVTAKH